MAMLRCVGTNLGFRRIDHGATIRQRPDGQAVGAASACLPEPPVRGANLRKWELRLIIEAILYVVSTGSSGGCCRRTPSWPSVHCHFNKWRKGETWLLIHHLLHRQARCDAGRDPEPCAAALDSQSVRATELAESRGLDGHKRVKGRKRHIAVDTLGIPLAVKVGDAN